MFREILATEEVKKREREREGGNAAEQRLAEASGMNSGAFFYDARWSASATQSG